MPNTIDVRNLNVIQWSVKFPDTYLKFLVKMAKNEPLDPVTPGSSPSHLRWLCSYSYYPAAVGLPAELHLSVMI